MTKTLEQKTKKIDWKEWIPVYGVYQACKDKKEGKLNVMENINYSGTHAGYQASCFSLLIINIYHLAERLF